MRKKKLVWIIYPTYLLVIFLCLLPIAWIMAGVDKNFYFQETTRHLKAQVFLVERCLRPILEARMPRNLERFCQELGKGIDARITVVMPDGRVLADTKEDPRQMENHADRPEIQQTLAGKSQVIQRHSYTLHEDMIYLAIPHFQDNKIAAIIRLSITVDSFFQTLKTIYFQLALTVLFVALFAILVSGIIARYLTKPLEEMQACANSFAAGNFHCALPRTPAIEIQSLAESFQAMGRILDDYLRTTIRQKNEQEAILTSMQEGVLAVDAEEILITLNQSAARLLGIDAEKAIGQNFRAGIRHPELQRMILATLQSTQPIQGEIILYLDSEKTLLINGTRWMGDDERCLGAVLVLNDISRLKNLEKIRREFVANVSHELKTPMTLIQGFVETLTEGALKDPEEAKPFLEKILRHTQRLNDLIDDLLQLSKIEQLEKTGIEKESMPLLGLLQAVVQNCEAKAEAKQIRLGIQCAENLLVEINPHLMEQAVNNLIDNAIKYSPKGSQVQVEGKRIDQEVQILVRDEGMGIAPEHLPRIFERFYRVDKGRDRQVGGTGLGLAIVKHILQVHGGRVSVQSILEQGSVFTLHLPVNK